MPVANRRKHQIQAAGDTPSRAGIMGVFETINDIVMVANTTERATVATDIAPTAARPLFVWRQDAPTGLKLEVTEDGTNWRRITDAPTAPLVAYGQETVNAGTTGTAEARIGGAHNIASAALVPGRAYEAVAAGLLNATGGAGLIRVNLRMSTTTPTATSPAVGTTQHDIRVAGGPGQQEYSTAGQPFAVLNAGTYQIHAFGMVVSGAATSMLLVPDARGVHSITLYDRGPAPSGLRTV
jgi:hypothetical protein